jgi:hypothetical protein
LEAPAGVSLTPFLTGFIRSGCREGAGAAGLRADRRCGYDSVVDAIAGRGGVAGGAPSAVSRGKQMASHPLAGISQLTACKSMQGFLSLFLNVACRNSSGKKKTKKIVQFHDKG